MPQPKNAYHTISLWIVKLVQLMNFTKHCDGPRPYLSFVLMKVSTKQREREKIKQFTPVRLQEWHSHSHFTHTQTADTHAFILSYTHIYIFVNGLVNFFFCLKVRKSKEQSLFIYGNIFPWDSFDCLSEKQRYCYCPFCYRWWWWCYCNWKCVALNSELFFGSQK